LLIPIRTDRSLRAIPYVTYGLLFLNTIIHLCALHLSDGQFEQFVHNWGFTMGHPSPVTMFTSAFLHADWTHLVGNMLILWIVGTVLEAGIGSLQFLLLYLVCLVGAILLDGIVVRIFQPEGLMIPMIGASGAIAGITGFAAFRYYHIRVQSIVAIPNCLALANRMLWLPVIPIPYPFWLPFWVYVAYFAGKEIIFGIDKLTSGQPGGVANWAHLGGMGLGLLSALLLRSFQEGKRELALEDTAKVTSGEAPQQQARSFEELQRLLTQTPDDPELLEAMAGLALANGEMDASKTLYLKAIPNFIKLGRNDRAAVSYLNVIHHFPSTVLTPREQLALGAALEAQGHYTEAADAFSLLYDHYPQTEEAQTGLLRAAQVHARYLRAAPVAVNILQLLLEEYPASPWETIARERLNELKRQIGA